MDIVSKIKDKNYRMYISELIAEINKPHPKPKKIEIIQAFMMRGQREERAMGHLLECFFHPGVVFELPEGDVPYKKDLYDNVDLARSDLYREIDKVKYYCRCSSMAQNPMKREQIFIQSLESMHPDESEILIAAKDKNWKKISPRCSENIIREAIPGLLPEKETSAKKSGTGSAD